MNQRPITPGENPSQVRADSVPFYPILDPYELGDLHDHRSDVPLELRHQLSEADYVIHIVTPEIQTPQLRPSAIREILRLTNAPRTNEIGHHGGSVASLASSENRGVESLRKFETLHSRDALEIALKLQQHYPDLLRTTIVSLAQTQGLKNETYTPDRPFHQEEPGRIMLLDRDEDDPIGQKFSDKLNWGWPFYGSIDATPTFISATVQYTREHDASFLDTPYSGQDKQSHTVREALDLSTNWLLCKLDENKEGLLEFNNTARSGGMDSQAWKDSAFAYLHADGSRANHKNGIASVEVQALAYDALLDRADLCMHQARSGEADELRDRAVRLRRQIIESFWIDDPVKGDYFALATDRGPDGAARALKVRSSNMGHLLQSRLLETNDTDTQHMRDAVVKQLFSPELLHHSGIRTLASDEAGFRPGGYHTGSVWLWDTARIADGLERHNYHHLAWNLRERIWHTVEETRKFPEFVRGGDSRSVEISQSEVYVWNTEHHLLHLFEQPPQEIQGWTVSAILAAKYAYPSYVVQKNRLPTNQLEQSILNRLSEKDQSR